MGRDLGRTYSVYRTGYPDTETVWNSALQTLRAFLTTLVVLAWCGSVGATYLSTLLHLCRGVLYLESAPPFKP